MQYCLPLAFLFLFVFSNCDDDDAGPSDAYGSSTQIDLVFTPTDGSVDVYEISYGDPDGPDGPMSDQLISSSALPANQTFTVQVSLSNTVEEERLIVDKNRVILANATQYELRYSTATVLQLELVRTDQDPNGDPIGLQLSATTGSPSEGGIEVEVWKDVESKTTGNLGGALADRWVVPVTIE